MSKSTTRIALVTGGSRGLGKDMALRLAQYGNDVIVTYNTKADEARAVVSDIQKTGRKAAALQLDAGHIAGFDAFARQLGKLLDDEFGTSHFDHLINNAGFGISVPSFALTTEAQFDELMNVHFKGTFFLTQKLLSLINDHGSIVNVSSGLTRFSAPGYSAYAGMKSAVETLTKYLAKELGARYIRANVVAPGAIATDFNNGAFRDTPQMQEYIKSLTALPRIGMPDDIGGVVAFLCSADAKWITGQRLEVAGGVIL